MLFRYAFWPTTYENRMPHPGRLESSRTVDSELFSSTSTRMPPMLPPDPTQPVTTLSVIRSPRAHRVIESPGRAPATMLSRKNDQAHPVQIPTNAMLSPLLRILLPEARPPTEMLSRGSSPKPVP